MTSRNCERCGGEVPPRLRGGPPKKFCSRNCREKASHAAWRSRNPDKAKAKSLDWRARNPDKVRAHARSWYRANPHKAKAGYARTNARAARARFHALYGDDTPYTIENMTNDRYRHARIAGYRSGLEVKVAKELEAAGVAFEYEAHKLRYIKPAKSSTYSPDYLLPNNIVVETKGRFTTEDRQKHILLKAQHPDMDLRFVFSRSAATISKASRTTYADWCIKNGFTFADKSIPAEWLAEAPRPLPTFIN